MIRTLATNLRRWAGRSEAAEAAQPLLAGYHRSPRRWIVVSAFALLAIFCIAYGFAFDIMAPARMTPFAAPMVLIGGLISSTLIARIVTPAMYLLLAPKDAPVAVAPAVA